MSNLGDRAEDDRKCNKADCDSVELVIPSKLTDLGRFSVRRMLPVRNQKMVGPWIFFDHMGPANFAAGDGINVRAHPHIGIATVTYLFEGEILHRDSLGSFTTIVPGDINLMVAGKGIVHSEKERPEIRNSEHRLHGLQLWLALPEQYEEIEPAFYHYPSSAIPSLDISGVPIRVMIGEAYGASSPVKIYADTLYIEAHLQKAQSIVLPDAEQRAVYIAEGSVIIDGVSLSEYSMAVLKPDSKVTVVAVSNARIAVIGGEAMSSRFINWNFVSSRRERIEQAKEDWRAQRFPKVSGEEDDFIPLPD